jgi:hypothetical protein
MLREAGLSARQDPLILTDGELNAFLEGHVQIRDAPVWPVHVVTAQDQVELSGVATVGRLLTSGLGPRVAGFIPRALQARPVWVAVRGAVVIGPGGRAEFRTDSGVIGQQAVPVALFWRLLGGRPSGLAWRMPRVVERIDSEPGRLVIHTRRPPAGRGAPG